MSTAFGWVFVRTLKTQIPTNIKTAGSTSVEAKHQGRVHTCTTLNPRLIWRRRNERAWKQQRYIYTEYEPAAPATGAFRQQLPRHNYCCCWRRCCRCCFFTRAFHQLPCHITARRAPLTRTLLSKLELPNPRY
jgi:hypothetical protein